MIMIRARVRLRCEFIPFSKRKGYTAVKKCLKFVYLFVHANQKRAFLFFVFRCSDTTLL
jgi:hypothetical protein